MKRIVAVLVALFVLFGLFGQQVSAESGKFVLEGGINRVEGFVPFTAGVTVHTTTADSYDVIATVYRSDDVIDGIRIEIGGCQSSWTPWVSSGTGTQVFQNGIWIFQMNFSASGNIEAGLRAPTPVTVNHITVVAQDGDGVSETRVVDVSPVGQPTSTPASTATPTETPTSTATPVPTAESLIVLEGGVNTVDGFTPFNTALPITITATSPVDIIVTVYNRGEADGVRVVVSGDHGWQAKVTGTTATPYFDAQLLAWVVEGDWSGEGPIELVIRTGTPPFRPSAWSIDVSATPLGTDECQERDVVVHNDAYGVFLPLVK